MKTIVLIVIGLLVITLLILAFCKKKTKTDTELHPVTAYNPTSREYDYRQRENLVEQSDTKYTVPTQEVQQIELTRSAVEHASSRAKAVIRINPAFFNKLKNTYAPGLEEPLLPQCGGRRTAPRSREGVPAGSGSAPAQQQR